jgi:hypothetical protein
VTESEDYVFTPARTNGTGPKVGRQQAHPSRSRVDDGMISIISIT